MKLSQPRSMPIIAFGSFLTVAATAFGQAAPPQTRSTISDAQVQANVLRALASASDLASLPINTTTVYGVVTLAGSVPSEAQRTEAENLAARASGVQKVVDELTLSADAADTAPPPPQPSGQAEAQAPGQVLQSDGTYATAPPPSPDSAQQAPAPVQQQQPDMAAGPNYGPGAPEYRQPYNPQQAPPPPGYPPQQDQQSYPGYAQQPPYPQQQPGYPQQAPPPPGYPQQQQGYNQPPPQPGGYYGAPAYAGQPGGQPVTVPAGALLRIRINQTLDSSQTKPGERFDGVVINDVSADGAIAIPRGAIVQGTVVDAKKSGALSGRGELSLQLTSINLGGTNYPIASDIWAHNGADKAVQSVNNTVIGGVLGALVGAAAGGGQGAAIGAGIGGAAGLGTSAASHSGQVFIPAEGMLTFHLAQSATITTLSQAEMDRLSQGAGPGGPRRLQRRGNYPPPPPPPPYYRPYPYPY